MGWPVLHSRSPAIHTHWIREHGLCGDYVLLPVQPDDLPKALQGLKALGFAGCNLTIPHKVAAMAWVDKIDPLAQRIGAINTVVVRDGQLIGYNTDAYGYIQSLLEIAPDLPAKITAAPVTVLGAGGAARAILAALAEQNAKEIRITNRSADTGLRLAEEFAALFPKTQWKALPWEQRNKALADCALLVNTTSLGMHGQPALDIALDALPSKALVSDIIYTPLETPLLAAAKAQGHATVNGLGMLLHQARPAFEHWFGIKPEVTGGLRQSIEATLDKSAR